MKIAVIGAGRIGETLGKAWAEAGHNVMYGLRDPRQDGAEVATGTLEDAAHHGEVVVFAIPGTVMLETAKSLALDGKIIIDCTNGGPPPDEIAQATPSAQVYKAFNTLGFENFSEPQFGDERADLVYIGAESKRSVVEQLIADVGLNPVYVGGLDQIETLNAAMHFWFALSKRFGRHTAFKVLIS